MTCRGAGYTVALACLGLLGPAAQGQDIPCVAVQAGTVSVPSFDCLNARLQAMAAAEQMRQQQSIPAAVDATGPADRLGETTHAGAALRFGPNFGISPRPYRPQNSGFYGNPSGLAGLLPGSH